MKHDSHTTTSWWSIGEWRLGWKVIAVLALPMIVAVVLGALRVQTELEEAAQLSSSSERALAVPAAINLESALYELAEAASARTDTGPATQAVSDAMDQLVERRARVPVRRRSQRPSDFGARREPFHHGGGRRRRGGSRTLGFAGRRSLSRTLEHLHQRRRAFSASGAARRGWPTLSTLGCATSTGRTTNPLRLR